MSEPRSNAPIRPRPKPLTVIGLLNLLFGAVLVAVAWSMLGGMAFNRMTVEPYEGLKRALMLQAEREHREVMATLAEREAAAQSEDARQVFHNERERRASLGPKLPPGSELMMMGSQMQSFGTWSVVSSASSLGINVLMIVAGAGLLQRVEWGRRLSLWVAGIKLARLLILQTVFVVFVVPSFARQLGKAVEETMTIQGRGMPAGMPNMTQLYAGIYTVMGIGMLILGAIYPIVMLVLLNRPGVKAASLPAEVRASQIMLEAGRGR
ncbi:hypothetical protein [Tautonia marina]|uniref:hypothetical protein n=1 Tax=Tautonia marina TaxID=2653855 RepID=UPI0012611383|nr:hypothetical protein [Tautonia marina]